MLHLVTCDFIYGLSLNRYACIREFVCSVEVYHHRGVFLVVLFHVLVCLDGVRLTIFIHLVSSWQLFSENKDNCCTPPDQH